MRYLPGLIAAAVSLTGQETAPVPAPAGEETKAGWKKAGSADPVRYQIDTGTRIPLQLINSVSSKHAAEGDRVYLETAFPILNGGRIVIPPGSYVAGTITQVKRPGRVKGRGELFVRFDSITLPNGVTRDFRARIGGLDGRASEELDRAEGKVKSEGNKSGDARGVGEATAVGASVGAIATRGGGAGVGIGAAAGAAAGMIGVLLSRGPDAVLARGTTLELVLDRPLFFDDSELDFNGAGTRRSGIDASGPLPSKRDDGRRAPLGRFPF